MILAATAAVLATSSAPAVPAGASLEPFTATALYEALIAEPQSGFGCRHAPNVANAIRGFESATEARTQAAARKIRQQGISQEFDEVDQRSRAGQYYAWVSPSARSSCGRDGDARELKRWNDLMVVLEEFERRAGVDK